MARAYPKSWQIVGKLLFWEIFPERRKVRIAADLLVIMMVGLGGLEPPNSPLSGARSSHLSYRPFELEWRLETTRAVYDGSAKSAIASRFWCIHPIVLMLAPA